MFLVFDIETCSFTEKPSFRDDIILAIGLRSLDKSKEKVKKIWSREELVLDVWEVASNSNSPNIHDAEKEVISQFKNNIDALLEKEPVALIGFNILRYDIPLLANKLAKYGLMDRVSTDEYLYKKDKLFIMDLIDVFRFVTLPKKYSFGFDDLICLINSIYGQQLITPRTTSGREFVEICRNVAENPNAILNDYDFGDMVRNHLEEDLKALKMMSELLFSPEKKIELVHRTNERINEIDKILNKCRKKDEQDEPSLDI